MTPHQDLRRQGRPPFPPLPAVSLAVFFTRARSAGLGVAYLLSLVFVARFYPTEWVSG